ncbi:hypothetical protein SAMN04488543_4012 [Friedmanniella luteola]|uniref:Uncharacterized protein n=1 Tax=Friedmanniella luteola TaxID=546871 RepID=A0A1H1ZU34_9ACTN|nr:hypothetical protein [Friedmanniella luteola]SDT37305.1 hypothetical protein SAMN04488543_4012 [Friedmanniella luteola]
MRPTQPPPALDVGTWRALAALDPAGVSALARRVAGTRLPPVNTAVVSPAGFVGDTGPRLARVRSRGTRMEVVDRREVLADLGAYGLLDSAGLARLRPYRAVEVDAGAAPGPLLTARLLAQLLVAGVPPLVDHLPVSVERLLGDQLAAVLHELDRPVLSSPVTRTAWSVRARRQALRRLTATGRPVPVGLLVDWTDETGGARSLEEARRQDWPDLVVVLVTGPAGAAAARRAAARGPGSASVVLGEDRAAALAAAVDELRAVPSAPSLATVFAAGLSYGPHHVTDLVLARGYARSPLVGVDVRRSFLVPLDLGVEDAGEEGERPGRALTPGTVLAEPQDLLEVACPPAGAPPARGYAVHDGGVTRVVHAAVGSELETRLAGASRQWRGWAEPGADQDATPGPPGRERGRATYPSYFSRP